MITDVNKKIELSGIFILDLNEFEKLSREVGYFNCKANRKYYTEDNDEYYDKDDIKQYEKLRGKQLDMQELLIERYGKNV